jgi:hypothetical protein
VNERKKQRTDPDTEREREKARESEEIACVSTS